jgi:hypothetical protein
VCVTSVEDAECLGCLPVIKAHETMDQLMGTWPLRQKKCPVQIVNGVFCKLFWWVP